MQIDREAAWLQVQDTARIRMWKDTYFHVIGSLASERSWSLSERSRLPAERSRLLSGRNWILSGRNGRFVAESWAHTGSWLTKDILGHVHPLREGWQSTGRQGRAATTRGS